MYQFESNRLGFRLWKDEDKIPFSIMNADNNVMKYFPNDIDKDESDNFIERIKNHFEINGYGLWAVEEKKSCDFIGFIGFYTATFESDFTPCVEIGWRLSNRYWNKGYATEGAKKSLEYGFNILELNKVYSFTSEINKPSINVMKKIGLLKQKCFLHPNIDDNNPLKPHVLYKIDKKAFNKNCKN